MLTTFVKETNRCVKNKHAVPKINTTITKARRILSHSHNSRGSFAEGNGLRYMCQSTQIDSSPKAVYSRRRKTKYGFRGVFIGTRNADAEITADPATSWNINLHYAISLKHRSNPWRWKNSYKCYINPQGTFPTCAFVTFWIRARIFDDHAIFAWLALNRRQFSWRPDKWLYRIAYIIDGMFDRG